MKKIFFYLLFFINSCAVFKSQFVQVDKCSIIQAILDQKEVNKILGLNDSTRVVPSIRIFDLSESFIGCDTFYIRRFNSMPVMEYYVESELKPSINTGTFRDLVIHKFSFDKTTSSGKIILSAATFETHNNVNTNFRIVYKFEVCNDKSIQIIDKKITEYIDRVVSHDY